MINEAVVASLELADFTLVKRAVSHVFAFVALFLNIAVGFLEDKLVFRKVVDCLAVELLGAVVVEALFFIDKGLSFQILEEIDGQGEVERRLAVEVVVWGIYGF